MTGSTLTPATNMVVASPTPVSCGQCGEAVVDGRQASIACDTCGKWFHIKKQCSMKRDIFKVIDKDFQWVCRHCVKCISDQHEIPYQVLKTELTEQRKLNLALKEQVTEFKEMLNLKEIEIIDLKYQLKPDKALDDVWHRVGKSSSPRPRPKCNSEGGPSVLTRNSFEALEGLDIESNRTDETVGSVSGVGESENVVLRPRPTSRGNGNKSKRETATKKQARGGIGKLKVHFEADSNGRKIGKFISQNSSRLSVLSTVRPGAPMRVVVEGAQNRLASMKGEGECLVVLGGVNDLTEKGIEETKIQIAKLLSEGVSAGKKIIVVETPYRYDDLNLNHQIKSQNSLLKGMCQHFLIPFISINPFLYRMHYTMQGLHLNDRGKSIIANIVASALENFLFLAGEAQAGTID